MRLRIGSLFSGYGGLDMGVMAALGGEVAWHVELEQAPSAILTHHWPDVPNYGDVTTVKWVPDCPVEMGGCGRPAEVLADKSGWQCNRCQMLWPISLGRAYWPEVPEPVDILTGGSPCQDLSHAGKRAGMTEGTRSNLWVAMREAIAVLRPSLVVWENVRGAYSAAADSSVVLGGRLLAPSDGGPTLRALGRVLGDLSDLGYDAWWHGLRAADVGAPHGRFRVFVVAYPQGDPWRIFNGDACSAADTLSGGRDWRARESVRGSFRGAAAAGGDEDALLPTPRTSDTNGASQHGDGGLDLRTAVTLLPTPLATDGTKGGPNQRGSSGGLMLPSAVTLLPTPTAVSYGRQRSASAGAAVRPSLDTMAREPDRWGEYAAAIHHWEALTRPAPEPTVVGAKGNPRLNPAFSEWMMGLPEGHVTAVPGLSRNDQLKALGNGVVPQQSEAAVRAWVSWIRAALGGAS